MSELVASVPAPPPFSPGATHILQATSKLAQTRGSSDNRTCSLPRFLPPAQEPTEALHILGFKMSSKALMVDTFDIVQH
jgi:hypothetical protein